MISILVLHNGQIIEKGNFKELLAINGKFASMWADQGSEFDDANGVKKEMSKCMVESEETKQENPLHTVEILDPTTSAAESGDIPGEGHNHQ